MKVTKYQSFTSFVQTILFILIFFSPQRIKTQNSYATPVFEDKERLAKIKLAIPYVDSLYKSIALKNHYPGLAYCIVVDGKTIHSGQFGYTDIENKIPVTSKSMFRIASMSKSVTAVAILHLRDQGKLKLDDPVSKYIPEFANQIKLTEDSPDITIRHCLTHATGFPEDNPWGDRQLQDSDDELMALIKKQIVLSNIPDFTYEYSNLGFALLGRIITVVSGMPYQKYIKENILIPLDMDNTDWEYDNIEKSKLAHGYRWLDNDYREEELLHDNPNGSWGAMGSMISSVEEFGNYLAMHMEAWPPRSDADTKPISRTSLREMHKPWNFSGFNPNYRYSDNRLCPTAAAYGYGLRWLKDCDDKIYVGHSGGLPGFGSHWLIMPEYGIGVISLANRTYAGTTAINMEVADAMVRFAGLKPRKMIPSAILLQRQKELLQLLPEWKDAEKTNIFAENFFPDLILSKLKAESKSAFHTMGKIVKVHDIQADNQLRGTFLIEGENTDIKIFFTLTPENPPQIQAYRLMEVAKPKK